MNRQKPTGRAVAEDKKNWSYSINRKHYNGECYDCGSDRPGYHTRLCDLAPPERRRRYLRYQEHSGGQFHFKTKGEPPMAKAIDVEEVGLVHIPKKQQEANQAQVPMEHGTTALDSIYDHYQKKIYLFDRSWSMETGMAPEDEKLAYSWSEQAMKDFRKFIADGFEAAVLSGDMDPDEAADQVKELADDDKLKKYVIENRLHAHPDHPELALPRDYQHVAKTERKIDAVRGAMKRFVEKRFQKFPDAQVGMVGFGSYARWMCYPGAPKPEVLLAVEGLGADFGGTDIVAPIKLAITEFKKRPSHVQSHHIVMVTDAEASISQDDVTEFLKTMKEMNIMFDFIYVQGQDAGSRLAELVPDSALALLKKMCKETGGEYVEVSKSSDFEIKFFKASERKALPPAGRL